VAGSAGWGSLASQSWPQQSVPKPARPIPPHPLSQHRAARGGHTATHTHLRRRSRRTMAALSHAARRRVAEHWARRGARSRAGSVAAEAQHTARAGQPAAAASSHLGVRCGTAPTGEARLPQRRRLGCCCLRRLAWMCWWPRQCRASGHRLLEPTRAPPLARPLCCSAPPACSRRRAPPRSPATIAEMGHPYHGHLQWCGPSPQHPAAPSQTTPNPELLALVKTPFPGELTLRAQMANP
jgi:hypothetical protein